MAASFNESQKLDFLYKKLGYGVAKTSIPPPGSGSKEAFNESIASPLLYRGDLVWKDSGDIPASPPSNTTAIVEVYKDGVGSYSPTVQCTEDLTSPDNQTWKTNLTNWIPTQFGDNYLVVVFVDTTGSTTPQTTGTRLFQTGSGSDDTWFFDYQAGVLNFNGATIPSVIASGISGKSVFIVGYRYVGPFGVGGDTGNITFANTTISTNLANGNITLTATGNGLVTISGTSGITIPYGNTVQRPDPAVEGTLRYNNALNQTEIYTGSDWESVGGTPATITNQTITPDGSSTTYTLDQTATAAGILVTINGISQTPNVAYTVSTNQITFADVPETTDIIQVRFISIVSTVTSITNSAGNAEINTTVSGNINFEINSATVAQVTNTSILNISTGHSLQLPAYTVTQANGLGNVATGQVIYVSNGAAGSPCLAVYTGGAWKQVAIGNTITT